MFRAFCGRFFSTKIVPICGNLHSARRFRGRLQFLDAETSDDAEDESMSVGVLFEVVHACLAPVAEVADAPRGVQCTEAERRQLHPSGILPCCLVGAVGTTAPPER